MPATLLRYLFCLVLIGQAPVTMASDLAKEQRWAEQIVDSLLDGEAVYLNDGTSDFLTIVTESQTDETRRGAVVIHGIGVHPNWPTIVQPLRVGLTGKGWHTVSIQMPVLPNEADGEEYLPLFPEASPRIEAAVRHLREEMGVKTVVVVAHSLGASMAAYHLAGSSAGVDGFVAIGVSPGREGTNRDTLAHLAAIRLPVYDLYGSDDLPAVVRGAARRQAAAGGNADYSQFMARGADHFFDGEEEVLLKRVNDWLQRF